MLIPDADSAQEIYLASIVLLTAVVFVVFRGNDKVTLVRRQNTFSDLLSSPPLTGFMTVVSMCIVLGAGYSGFRIPLEIEVFYQGNGFHLSADMPDVSTTLMIRSSQIISSACLVLIAMRTIKVIFGLAVCALIVALSTLSFRYIFQM